MITLNMQKKCLMECIQTWINQQEGQKDWRVLDFIVVNQDPPRVEVVVTDGT